MGFQVKLFYGYGYGLLVRYPRVYPCHCLATKSEYEVLRGCIEPMESYGLVGWFRVDMSEISFQVGSSSPIFLLSFSLYSIKATRLAYKFSRGCVKPLESYQLSDIEN